MTILREVVQLGLALLARLHELAPAAVQLVVQPPDECERVLGQHLVVAALAIRRDLDRHALVSFL
jgi:hypothetical protein